MKGKSGRFMINSSHEMENTNFGFFVIFPWFTHKNGLRVAMNLQIVIVDILFYHKDLYYG